MYPLSFLSFILFILLFDLLLSSSYYFFLQFSWLHFFLELNIIVNFTNFNLLFSITNHEGCIFTSSSYLSYIPHFFFCYWFLSLKIETIKIPQKNDKERGRVEAGKGGGFGWGGIVGWGENADNCNRTTIK